MGGGRGGGVGGFFCVLRPIKEPQTALLGENYAQTALSTRLLGVVLAPSILAQHVCIIMW